MPEYEQLGVLGGVATQQHPGNRQQLAGHLVEDRDDHADMVPAESAPPPRPAAMTLRAPQVTDRTLKAWLDGKRRPSKANLERIDAVYRTVRRHNVARHLLWRLNSGRGTRVEIHPFNQSQVARPHQRVVEFRKLNVRRWDRIVTAWANRDQQALDDVWTTDVLPDLGSQWGQYEYVSNIGFAA
ncbi:transcriptional regulator [Streptomyces sp. NPDC002619]|uniref:transcriptional regulator n=1 Tax=Streptomyces sp. NPDC002619 TaxID=3364655 RepID=UPI0036848559